MSRISWAPVADGGTFESLMHAILYAQDPSTILFGRPGKDAGQDARTASGQVVYQAKYRQQLNMDGAVQLAKDELETIKSYRQPNHTNHSHWANVERWVLYANVTKNPNDATKWNEAVRPLFLAEGIDAEIFGIEEIENALVSHPEIESVFFEGENRVLVGLKEAHQLLSSEPIGGPYLDSEIVGCETELGAISEFANQSSHSLLPVLGPAAIGKSRLAYEALRQLASEGWRVLWALPESMGSSTQWFRLLNGNQKTFVVIDAPSDVGVLKALMEQLSTSDRAAWRVLFTSRTDRIAGLRSLLQNRRVAPPLEMKPLSEVLSKQLLTNHLGDEQRPGWQYSVFQFTNGYPGWLMMIIELAKENRLENLPQTRDGIASLHIQSCLNNAQVADPENARILIRWLSLWGKVRLETFNADQPTVAFLKERGVSCTDLQQTLSKFVKAGLVRNWGVGKSLYAVEPVIVRQHVLSDWLLDYSGGTVRMNEAGNQLLTDILDGKVAHVESVLETLSSLFYSDLDSDNAAYFLQPLFHTLVSHSTHGDLRVQKGVLELAEKIGPADPEGIVDVIGAIRQNQTKDYVDENAFWGPTGHSHRELVEELPWLLFRVSKYAANSLVANRILNEFAELGKLEGQGDSSPEPGKSVNDLVKRLMRESSAAGLYATTGADFMNRHFQDPQYWPFLSWLIDGLTHPVKETVSTESNWTVTFSRRAISPGTPVWDAAMKARDRVWGAIRSGERNETRSWLLQSCVETHHAFHRALSHERLGDQSKQAYEKLLIEDLQNCKLVLSSDNPRPVLEDMTTIRGLWKWYVEHGRESELKQLATECETLFSSLSEWQVQDFFRFERESALASETQRVADRFRDAADAEVLQGFFAEAQLYLSAARGEHGDLADNWRIQSLAVECSNEFTGLNAAEPNSVTVFVQQTLQSENPNPLAWYFAIILIRLRLGQCKEDGSTISEILREFIEATRDQKRFVSHLYRHPHPTLIGNLTAEEFDAIRSIAVAMPVAEQMQLCGSFYMEARTDVVPLVEKSLRTLDTRKDKSNCLGVFIRDLRLFALRFELKPEQADIRWLLKLIQENEADGRLLEFHDFEELRNECSFRMSMAEFLRLVQSRIALERGDRPNDDFRIFPSDFKASEWCEFDVNDTSSVEHFFNLCELQFDDSFIGTYWIHQFVVDLDGSGDHVASFVEQRIQLAEGKDAIFKLAKMAEGYSQESNAWRRVATPICQKANGLSRRDREHVYFGLSKKSTPALTSMPGEVPVFYVEAAKNAKSRRDNEPTDSPLRAYFEWAAIRAQAMLESETERAEEDFDA